MSVYICIVVLIVLIIFLCHREFHILVSHFTFSHLSHKVFLKRSCQIISVREIESFIDLNLLEIVEISIFIVSVLAGLLSEHWHQLHILDRVNTMSKQLTNPLTRSNEDQVVAF